MALMEQVVTWHGCSFCDGSCPSVMYRASILPRPRSIMTCISPAKHILRDIQGVRCAPRALGYTIEILLGLAVSSQP